MSERLPVFPALAAVAAQLLHSHWSLRSCQHLSLPSRRNLSQKHRSSSRARTRNSSDPRPLMRSLRSCQRLRPQSRRLFRSRSLPSRRNLNQKHRSPRSRSSISRPLSSYDLHKRGNAPRRPIRSYDLYKRGNAPWMPRWRRIALRPSSENTSIPNHSLISRDISERLLVFSSAGSRGRTVTLAAPEPATLPEPEPAVSPEPEPETSELEPSLQQISTAQELQSLQARLLVRAAEAQIEAYRVAAAETLK